MNDADWVQMGAGRLVGEKEVLLRQAAALQAEKAALEKRVDELTKKLRAKDDGKD